MSRRSSEILDYVFDELESALEDEGLPELDFNEDSQSTFDDADTDDES